MCPFHDDREPSFGVTPSKNLWNCLAGCGGGDVITLVMKKQGVSFRHAVEVLRRRLGIAPAAAPVVKTRMGTTHEVLADPASELADHVLLRHVRNFIIRPSATIRRRCVISSSASASTPKRSNCSRSAMRIGRLAIASRRERRRRASGWGNTQLKLHLARLQEMEYLLVHRGERGQSYVYELLYEGQGADGKPFLMGLIDVEKLRAGGASDSEKSVANADRSATGRAVDGPESAPGRGDENPDLPAENRPIPADPHA